MADFPTVNLAGLEDSKYFEQEVADPAQRTEVDGGYTLTRPRYTRTPRKSWKTGFTDLTDTEKAEFDAFWDTQRGGSNSFTYLNPADAVTYTVRFVGTPRIKYSGMGPLRRWDITNIKLEQI